MSSSSAKSTHDVNTKNIEIGGKKQIYFSNLSSGNEYEVATSNNPYANTELEKMSSTQLSWDSRN